MPRQPYPTDLTDREWAILEPHLPPAKPGGRRRGVDLRASLNGIVYLLRGGGAGRRMPPDLPPWPTSYADVRRGQRDGTWETLHRALRAQGRRSVGRPATPSAAVVDSQSVKTTAKGGRAAMLPGSRSRDARGPSSSIRSA